ncbi:MAG TPA: COX15/CtaA family protein [Nocardioidaceae bacterium]|nr:COX15/CtaA family protein [Nocardioidaceae bacterium]
MGLSVVRLIDGLRSPTRATLSRLGVATLVANIVIVLTGGAVRLTGSGLGCPKWPKCTDSSLVVHGDMGVHGFIEFGNRMLTFVLAAVAILTWVAVMRYQPARRSLRRIATALALGIPLQAVLGGLTVLTDLNPWLVAGHLLLSLAMVGLSVVFLRRIVETDRPPTPTVPLAVQWLARATFATAWLVLYAGTVVTGSGPHAGDEQSARNGLSPSGVSQLHADLVFLLVGLTVGIFFAFKAVGAPERAQRAATWLLTVEIAQGAVGFTQYFTDLPVGLVEVHLLGAALVSATATWVVLGVRDRGIARDLPTGLHQDPTFSTP